MTGVVGWPVVVAVVVVALVRRPTERQVAAFAWAYKVPVTTVTTPLIADAITWSRRWRVAGGVVAAIAVWAWSGESGPTDPMAYAVGVAAGTLVAELTRRLRRSDTVRMASTDTRRVTDFVWRPAVAGFVGMWVLLVVAVLAASNAWTAPVPIASSVIVFAVVAVVVGGSALPLARLIARRPIPRDHPATAAVLHAVRAASVGSVLGGGLVVLAAAGFRVAFAVVRADTTMAAPIRHLNSAVWWVTIAATVGGIGLVLSAFPRWPSRAQRAAAR